MAAAVSGIDIEGDASRAAYMDEIAKQPDPIKILLIWQRPWYLAMKAGKNISVMMPLCRLFIYGRLVCTTMGSKVWERDMI